MTAAASTIRHCSAHSNGLGYDRTFEVIERAAPRYRRRRSVVRLLAARGVGPGGPSVSLPADLALDFGGIAKGWTVDRVALVLAPLGPVLVDAGGDLRVDRAGRWRGMADRRAGSVRAGTRPRRRASGRAARWRPAVSVDAGGTAEAACCTTSSTREPARRRE